MSTTRTAKGTASNKTSALTLTVSAVTVQDDSLLVVGLSYDTGQGAPSSVKWGNQELELVGGSQVSGNGLATRIYTIFKRSAGTKDVVVTWTTTAPTAKAMFVSEFTHVASCNLVLSKAEVDVATPDAGTAALVDYDDEVFVGAMGSEGPSSDDAGTPSNSYSAGQRVGTTGAPPASNITIQEIYKIVTSAESTTAALTGATSRDWCSSLVTFRAPKDNRMGITITDLMTMRDIFNTNGYNKRDHSFHYNAQLDQWELWENDIDNGTLRATYSSDGSGWIE